MDAYLSDLYHNPNRPGNFSSPQKLYEVAKAENRYPVTLKYIKNWLKGQETYTLNRAAQRAKPHNRVIVKYIDDEWDCNLGDMQKLAKYNDGNKFIL